MKVFVYEDRSLPFDEISLKSADRLLGVETSLCLFFLRESDHVFTFSEQNSHTRPEIVPIFTIRLKFHSVTNPKLLPLVKNCCLQDNDLGGGEAGVVSQGDGDVDESKNRRTVTTSVSVVDRHRLAIFEGTLRRDVYGR